MLILLCWVEWMLWYLSLNTCLLSNRGGISSDLELRSNREYQYWQGYRRPVLFDRKFTKPSNSKCVVQYTLKWLPSVRCRGSQYTLTAACTLIDKIRSIKRAIHSGGLEDCTVGTRLEDELEDGLEGDRQKKNEDDQFFNQFRSIFACFVCLK